MYFLYKWRCYCTSTTHRFQVPCASGLNNLEEWNVPHSKIERVYVEDQLEISISRSTRTTPENSDRRRTALRLVGIAPSWPCR